MEGDTTETLTATIISVGPYGVTARRHWGEANAAGTMNVLIHEADSPGITRHAVGDTIRLRAAPTHHSERFVKLQEDE